MTALDHVRVVLTLADRASITTADEREMHALNWFLEPPASTPPSDPKDARAQVVRTWFYNMVVYHKNQDKWFQKLVKRFQHVLTQQLTATKSLDTLKLFIGTLPTFSERDPLKVALVREMIEKNRVASSICEYRRLATSARKASSGVVGSCSGNLHRNCRP